MVHWYFLFVLLLAVSVTFCVWFVFQFRKYIGWAKGSKIVYGKITSIWRGYTASGDRKFRVEVEYEVDGVKYKKYVGFYKPFMREGDEVKLHYKLLDPQRCTYLRSHGWFMCVLLFGTVLCSFLCAFVGWLIF
jgi:hypothetical protein